MSSLFQDCYQVDDSSGLLVVDPDRLVSGTSVVSSLFCRRKAALSEWFKGLEGGSKTMFVGTLAHSLLQESLRTMARTREEVGAVLEAELGRGAVARDLLALGMSREEARREVEPFLPHVIYFTEK